MSQIKGSEQHAEPITWFEELGIPSGQLAAPLREKYSASVTVRIPEARTWY